MDLADQFRLEIRRIVREELALILGSLRSTTSGRNKFQFPPSTEEGKRERRIAEALRKQRARAKKRLPV